MKEDAENSGQVVCRAVDAMGGIEKSSQQIDQILGVIACGRCGREFENVLAAEKTALVEVIVT